MPKVRVWRATPHASPSKTIDKIRIFSYKFLQPPGGEPHSDYLTHFHHPAWRDDPERSVDGDASERAKAPLSARVARRTDAFRRIDRHFKEDCHGLRFLRQCSHLG